MASFVVVVSTIYPPIPSHSARRKVVAKRARTTIATRSQPFKLVTNVTLLRIPPALIQLLIRLPDQPLNVWAMRTLARCLSRATERPCEVVRRICSECRRLHTMNVMKAIVTVEYTRKIVESATNAVGRVAASSFWNQALTTSIARTICATTNATDIVIVSSNDWFFIVSVCVMK